MTARATLGRQERIKSRKTVEQLFAGGKSHSMADFPLRIVYMQTKRMAEEPPVQMMVSVSKRHFKHAILRNRVKRQVREAYRLNKQALTDAVAQRFDMSLKIAFIWQADKTFPSTAVHQHMRTLLQRMTEKLVQHMES